MKKRQYNNILILVIFAAYIIYYRMFIAGSQLQIAPFINAAVIAVLSFVSVLLLGFRRDKFTPKKKAVLGVTLAELGLFFAVSYGLGATIGYSSNTYSFLSIIQNIFAPLIFLVAIEIFRYTIINANRDKKIIATVVTFLIICLELIIGLDGALMYNFDTTFRTISTIIIPIIIENAVMSYVTIYGGLKPVLVYRLIMNLYKDVLPVVPELGDYISSVIGILLPTMVYMYTSRLNSPENKESEEMVKKPSITLGDIAVFAFVIVLVSLISGRFTYSLIGIGSGSMEPKIAKGDAVIYKRLSSPKDLKEGDVIVFDTGTKIIIHRLQKINKDEDGTYYVTKGDANNAADPYRLEYKNIKGRVIFTAKYLAYPNLLLQELVK